MLPRLPTSQDYHKMQRPCHKIALAELEPISDIQLSIYDEDMGKSRFMHVRMMDERMGNLVERMCGDVVIGRAMRGWIDFRCERGCIDRWIDRPMNAWQNGICGKRQDRSF